MKIKSTWRRKWHDEHAVEDGSTIYMVAWHDDKMGVGLIVISYSEHGETKQKVLEQFAYAGDYRQTIQRAMGIWSKESPRYLKTVRQEIDQSEAVDEAEKAEG